jgi:hypothetical protein
MILKSVAVKPYRDMKLKPNVSKTYEKKVKNLILYPMAVWQESSKLKAESIKK